ncbi:MAG: histidine phosphatase family protein [Rhodospirillaceae bacterium]|nr:histidine phosphatase family protein [Rhodospirillaceae bacterium]
MTKVLHLLRHAKAELGRTDGEDHTRALAARGRKAIKHMGEAIKIADLKVGRVFCSTARRTRETFDALRHDLGNPPVSYRDRLYMAACDDLMRFIQGLPDDTDAAMIVGHNPGLHDVALTVTGRAGRGQAKGLNRLRTKFPTGALCTLTFDVPSWKKVDAGLGELTRFLRPRDLEEKT